MTTQKGPNSHRWIIDVPASLADKVDKICDEHGCDQSHVILILLDAHLSNLTNPCNPIDKIERHLDLIQEKWFGETKMRKKWHGKTKQRRADAKEKNHEQINNSDE